jgi:hypothetical protein
LSQSFPLALELSSVVRRSFHAVIPGRARKRVHARLRRAMGANPESSKAGIFSVTGFRARRFRGAPK